LKITKIDKDKSENKYNPVLNPSLFNYKMCTMIKTTYFRVTS